MSLHPYQLKASLPIALMIGSSLVYTLPVQATEYVKSYDFVTEEFLDEWEVSIDFESSMESYSPVVAEQEFHGSIDNLQEGMSVVFDQGKNQGTISLNQNTDIDLDVRLNGQFNVPETWYGDWMPASGCFVPYSNIVPSYLYSARADALTSIIGMSVWGGLIDNSGEINLNSTIDINLSAQTQMTLTTDNIRPTDTSVNLEDSYTWKINPLLITSAYVVADLSLVGMRAEDYFGIDSMAVNNGDISISAHLNRTDTTSADYKNEIGSFEVVFDNGNTLTVDTEGILDASTEVYGTAFASAMLGYASTATTSLINNGNIRISASPEYTAIGLTASVDQTGTVYVSNRGQIDLSQAQSQYKHELYAILADDGQVVMGDWLLSLDYLDQYVPFAILSDSATFGQGGSSRLSFAKNSTLYLKPTDSKQLNTDLSLGTLFGEYSSDGSSMSASLDKVDGFFSKIESASNMVDLKISGPDANHLSANLAVNAEKSLGHQSNYMTLTGDLNALLSLRAMTVGGDYAPSEESTRVSVKPWYFSLNDQSSFGFDSKGGGVIVNTETFKEGYRLGGYWAVAKENSDSDNNLIKADGTRFGVGLALSRELGDRFSIGGRLDLGKNNSDWTMREKFGSDKAGIDSQYIYGEIHSQVSYALSDVHAIGAIASVGYLHDKQDSFNVETLSTGRVHYDNSTLDTFLVRLGAQWNTLQEIDGKKVFSIVSLDTVYLTDPEFSTKFTYLDSHFKAKNEVSDWISTLRAGVGFSGDHLSLEVSAAASVGDNLKSVGLNGKISYLF